MPTLKQLKKRFWPKKHALHKYMNTNTHYNCSLRSEMSLNAICKTHITVWWYAISNKALVFTRHTRRIACVMRKFGYFYLNRTSGGCGVFQRSHRKNSQMRTLTCASLAVGQPSGFFSTTLYSEKVVYTLQQS